MHQKGQKGFTLVELMIVVAIIGILAAIAIPQFAQYRIRGFNSSAMSDIRNLNTSQAAFFTDWNRYGYTIELEADATLAAGVSIVAAQPDINLDGVLRGGEMAGYLIGAFIQNAARSQVIVVGSNVEIVAHSSNAAGGAPAAGPGVSFIAAAKHFQGDSTYAIDADSPTMYRGADRVAGENLTAGDIPLSATHTVGDDLAGQNHITTAWVAL